ncbi:Arc family DNA-binding protein [Salmonella enterica subsp. enterica serovar Kottbus]|nr:DNA-binding protein [Salmonella enterica subsp. enterica serovar Kottbus]ECD2571574.1 Arc family DNA-binding protein [Salmonella enterica subsp. enterica serovar Kottbus]ECY6224884.1 Arc family DNA-binding protein [Salmonella enterica subsp. enterica serovar Kottbus]EDV5242961.1 Arc family DNA-binding protein [Salmonella enterica subsp. enterica]
MEKEVSKILVRMPQLLKDAIGGRAKEECRSFNSEVIKRLMDSLKRDGVVV